MKHIKQTIMKFQYVYLEKRKTKKDKKNLTRLHAGAVNQTVNLVKFLSCIFNVDVVVVIIVLTCAGCACVSYNNVRQLAGCRCCF